MKSSAHGKSSSRRESRLWFAIFGPAAAWIATQQLGFVLSPLLCAQGGHWILYLLTASALAASAAGALAAWRTWRAIRGGASAAGEVGERRRFMAIAGFLLAVYFSLAIVALAIPQIVHRPCD